MEKFNTIKTFVQNIRKRLRSSSEMEDDPLVPQKKIRRVSGDGGTMEKFNFVQSFVQNVRKRLRSSSEMEDDSLVPQKKIRRVSGDGEAKEKFNFVKTFVQNVRKRLRSSSEMEDDLVVPQKKIRRVYTDSQTNMDMQKEEGKNMEEVRQKELCMKIRIEEERNKMEREDRIFKERRQKGKHLLSTQSKTVPCVLKIYKSSEEITPETTYDFAHNVTVRDVLKVARQSLGKPEEFHLMTFSINAQFRSPDELMGDLYRVYKALDLHLHITVTIVSPSKKIDILSNERRLADMLFQESPIGRRWKKGRANRTGW